MAIQIFGGLGSLVGWGAPAAAVNPVTPFALLALFATARASSLGAGCLSIERNTSISQKIGDLIAKIYPTRGSFSLLGFGEQPFDQAYNMLDQASKGRAIWGSALGLPHSDMAHLVSYQGEGLLQVAAQNNNTRLFSELVGGGIYVHEDIITAFMKAAELGFGDIVDIVWEKLGCVAYLPDRKDPIISKMASGFCLIGEHYFNQGDTARADNYFKKAQMLFSYYGMHKPTGYASLAKSAWLATQEDRIKAVVMQYYTSPKSRQSVVMFSDMVLSFDKNSICVGLRLVSQAIQKLDTSGECVPKQLTQAKNSLIALHAEGVSRWVQKLLTCRVVVPSPLSKEPLFDQRCVHTTLEVGVNYFLPLSKVKGVVSDRVLPQIDKVIPVSQLLAGVKERTTMPLSEAGVGFVVRVCNAIGGKEATKISDIVDATDSDWLAPFLEQTIYLNSVKGITGGLQDQLDGAAGLDIEKNPCPNLT